MLLSRRSGPVEQDGERSGRWGLGTRIREGTDQPQAGIAAAWALALTLTYMAAEVIGSLTLLADAAHMLTDAGGLALLAIRFAERPATPHKTYGYLRTEILSALANAVVLLLLTVYILYEAYKRFLAPPEILSAPMLRVAAVWLVVNLISTRLLAGGSSESLNVKGPISRFYRTCWARSA